MVFQKYLKKSFFFLSRESKNNLYKVVLYQIYLILQTEIILQNKGFYFLIALTIDEIDQYWNEMDKLELDDVPTLVNNLGKKQPYILTYLMATGNDILSQPEREALLFMGVMIWYIVGHIVPEVPEISGDTLDDCENKNLEMLEYLAGEPESEFMDTVERIMAKYHQAEFLRYIIDRLLEEPEKGIEISEDNMGMMVIYLKTIIDCLDSAIPDEKV